MMIGAVREAPEFSGSRFAWFANRRAEGSVDVTYRITSQARWQRLLPAKVWRSFQVDGAPGSAPVDQLCWTSLLFPSRETEQNEPCRSDKSVSCVETYHTTVATTNFCRLYKRFCCAILSSWLSVVTIESFLSGRQKFLSYILTPCLYTTGLVV